MSWHNGMGWAGWVVMVLTMAAFWSLAVLAVAALFTSDRQDQLDRMVRDPGPQQILDERLARGEIGADEYRARCEALGAVQ